ncbi:hypothetical protein RJT34_11940 [Clitoria ternatea]|uniref:Uncharacterized protein n=1 Tax=Clitoria ternatea TaxID=43366 RepID=A0AAN9JMY8_CLITE
MFVPEPHSRSNLALALSFGASWIPCSWNDLTWFPSRGATATILLLLNPFDSRETARKRKVTFKFVSTFYGDVGLDLSVISEVYFVGSVLGLKISIERKLYPVE